MNDPDWAAFIPSLEAAGPACRLPDHADCTPLDTEKAVRHLEPGGTLGRMPNYEPRPGQLDMLRAIVRAYNDRCHLMVEAGTGVGKSLAYLVPSVLWSFTNDTPVVVSTATRNLQSQLTGADLPRAASVLGAEAPKLRWTVLKGRTNYLCLRALEEYMQGGWWSLAPEEQNEFARFLAWLHETDDGDLDDFGGEELRARVNCPSEDCWGRACRYADKCFIAKARARALRAHVIVANHALVLSEAANPGAGLLPAYGRLVFDEAHNLEDIATDYFSYEFSRPAFLHVLGRLVRPGRARRGRPARTRGLLGAIERRLAKCPPSAAEAVAGVRELIVRVHAQTALALSAADETFAVLQSLFAPAPRAEILRYRTVAPACAGDARLREYSLNGLFAAYTAAQWDETRLEEAAAAFEAAVARVQHNVQKLGAALQRLAEEDGNPFFGDLAGQALGLVTQFTNFILEMKCVLAGADPARVFWVERMPAQEHPRQAAYLRLVGAPLSVAHEMKRCFYDVKDSVVLCSATLRTGDRFDYMARKLGLDLAAAEQPDGEEGVARVRALAAASPFDYFRQALVIAPDCLPEPTSSQYAAELAPFLVDVFRASHGRGLALFTSYEMMQQAADGARAALAAAGLNLLVQGEGLSREQMVGLLKRDPSTVLFGAQSFWEGVDVPGEALSCVVLARLPFPQLGEPVTEARSARVVESGGNEFRDFMLPEALIRFRQGFGRLVRTRRDRGVVVVADPRLARRNYGAAFRKAIPASVHIATSLNEVCSRIDAFFVD